MEGWRWRRSREAETLAVALFYLMATWTEKPPEPGKLAASFPGYEPED